MNFQSHVAMPVLAYLPTAQMRDICWTNIVNVEHWARRLINDTLSEIYGTNYFNYEDDKGNRLIKREIVQLLQQRMKDDTRRFPRMIDAVTFENIIQILCNENLYNKHFKIALEHAYPCGLEHAKHHLTIIRDIRNKYAHLNIISVRDAERAICYCHDFIDGLEMYYQKLGKEKDYNVPLFLKLSDSQGLAYNFSSERTMLQEHEIFDCIRLRAGDVYQVTVEVDPTFDPNGFTLDWYCEWEYEEKYKKFHNTNSIDINITNDMVGRGLKICCTLRTKKDWHKHGSYDDYFQYEIKTILPPISDNY